MVRGSAHSASLIQVKGQRSKSGRLPSYRDGTLKNAEQKLTL